MSRPFRFTHTWRLPAGPNAVFDVLRDIENYAAWWRQVRAVEPIDDSSARVTIRSAIPMDLRFVLAHERTDPVSGILRASLTGDLNGWSQWTLTPAPNGTVARFEEVASLDKGIPGFFDPILRPVWIANHTLMMRAGRRGIATYMSGIGDAIWK